MIHWFIHLSSVTDLSWSQSLWSALLGKLGARHKNTKKQNASAHWEKIYATLGQTFDTPHTQLELFHPTDNEFERDVTKQNGR